MFWMELGLWLGEILELLKFVSDGGGGGGRFKGIFYFDVLCKFGVYEFLILFLF